MKQKLIRVGPHSLGVVVPSEFVHVLGLKKGDDVEVKADSERAIVTYRFKGSLQLHLLNLKKGNSKD